jgi:predicted Rossmann fold flavoprotein
VIEDSFDVLVIGAGGAGMMAAIEAGKRGRRVAVLEHNESVGRKIGISGGGRCNFTNINAAAENYLSGNPDFCKSALARYTPWDFISLVEAHRIRYHEKTLGQQFCDTSSREIIRLLEDEAAKAGVKILLGCRILEVTKPERFRVETSLGRSESDSLIIATGGLSFPKLGASDLGYRVARTFGLKITGLRPGLVPLTWSGEDKAKFEVLSGVSVPVIASRGGHQFEENMLFTHRGLSGPAILQISSYWKEGQPVELDLMPHARVTGDEWLAAARREKADLVNLLGREWPRRFAEAFADEFAPKRPIAQWRADEMRSFGQSLRAWRVEPSGTEGYPKAEVTLGGVDTAELSSKTLGARKVPGLFFVGEVVDVTGWLGGYNFQWAWASGHAAGQVA